MGQTQELTVHHFRLVIAAAKKLLLAFAALFGAVLFVRMLLVSGLQAIFHPDDSVTSLVRRTGIIVSAVLAYWAYVRIVEDRNASELRPATLAVILGGAFGGLLIAISMLLVLALGGYEITAYRGLQHGLLGIGGLIVIAATLEEIAYRCILFRILETVWGTVPALCLQAVIFALRHLENIEGRAGMQELVTMIVSATLCGALWALVFVLSRNLWAAAANHAAWNFTIILSGLPLSGIEDWRRMAPIAGEYRGPVWLTGGLFGPESSIVTIVMLAVTVAAMLYWAKRRNRLISGAARRVDTLKPLQPGARHA